MADLQPGGSKVPDEKKGKEEAEKANRKTPDKAEKPVKLSESQKRALRRRRSIQRRKFSGELKKAGIESVAPGKKPPKPARAESRPESKPEKITATEPVEKEEFLRDRSMRVRDELHPRLQKTRQTQEISPAGAEPIVEKKQKEEIKTVKEEDKAPEEEEQPLPEDIVEPLTYLAHPFAVEDESSAEESVEDEEPAGESVSGGPVEEDELVIGEKPDKPLPVHVGKIREESKPAEKEEAPEESLNEIREERSAAEKVADEKRSAEAGKVEKELLGEKKSLQNTMPGWVAERLGWLRESAPGLLKGVKSVLMNAGAVVKPKVIVSAILVLLLAGGGYFVFMQGWPGKVGEYISGLFAPKPVEKVEKEGVIADANDQRKFGLVSAAIFAANRGSVNDLVPVQIIMADYFGGLKEPRVKGETGISAATFYGELKDGAGEVNDFVVYMDKLAEVQNLYKTDVYAMLDRSTERDRELLDYLDSLKDARRQSADFLSRIRVNMDDLTVSYESLTPDRAAYEKDFFAAMESLQPEKSDILLKGFVDISQKQTALKARVNALSKLVAYYETAVKRLDTRILAIEQNMDALVEGIRVVDIPGANIDFIIRPQTAD